MERNMVCRALECNDFYLDTTKFSPSKLIEVEAVRNACNNQLSQYVLFVAAFTNNGFNDLPIVNKMED